MHSHGHDPVNRLCGIYPAIVWDISDPDGRGRIRVKIPAVLGASVSGWAEPCYPPNWRAGLVKPHSTHTGHSNHNFTDTNNGTGASGNVPVTLTHDHNHDAHDNNHTLIGMYPAVGEAVWVMFIAGDPDHPVWLGTP